MHDRSGDENVEKERVAPSEMGGLSEAMTLVLGQLYFHIVTIKVSYFSQYSIAILHKMLY